MKAEIVQYVKCRMLCASFVRRKCSDKILLEQSRFLTMLKQDQLVEALVEEVSSQDHLLFMERSHQLPFMKRSHQLPFTVEWKLTRQVCLTSQHSSDKILAATRTRSIAYLTELRTVGCYEIGQL